MFVVSCVVYVTFTEPAENFKL